MDRTQKRESILGKFFRQLQSGWKSFGAWLNSPSDIPDEDLNIAKMDPKTAQELNNTLTSVGRRAKASEAFAERVIVAAAKSEDSDKGETTKSDIRSNPSIANVSSTQEAPTPSVSRIGQTDEQKDRTEDL